MGTKTPQPNSERARRFALHLPVYFRQANSSTWLEGVTENISYTGVLFRSSYSLVPETVVELRLQLAVGTQQRRPAEIRCKGAVVRVEERSNLEAPTAVAVAIKDYRIVRKDLFREGALEMSNNTDPSPKTGRRVQ